MASGSHGLVRPPPRRNDWPAPSLICATCARLRPPASTPSARACAGGAWRSERGGLLALDWNGPPPPAV
eukprot:1155947-Pyramimonas_sp.AAC.1